MSKVFITQFGYVYPMQSFLDSVAKKIIEIENKDLKNTAVIFPSRRALVFFKKALFNQMNANGWAPLMYSMEDFFAAHTSLQSIDQVDLLLHLYQVHKTIEQSNFQDFDEFIGWGSILIQDFNELDRHLIDAEELYDFLNEARAIERWELDQDQLTEIQDNYLKFWSSLKTYYSAFKAHLVERKLAYQGLIFRSVAESISELPFDKYNCYFVGFNAFTKAEQSLITSYTNLGKASLIFDSDDYYKLDKHQEAGHFLRSQLHKENAIFIDAKGYSDPKSIEIYGISGNIGQAKLCGDLIEKSDSKDLALVLSDEQLLLPLLDAIPKKIESINVTMGYPIGLSVTFRFIESIIQLYHEATLVEKELVFNTKKLLQVLGHPFWGSFNEPLQNRLKASIRLIEQSYHREVNASLLSDINQSLHHPLFSKLNSQECVGILLALVEEKTNHLREEATFELTELYELLTGLRRLNDRLKDQSFHISWKSLTYMFRHVFAQSTVSFIGEAVSGLQIMGILESRALDFETLILTSVNEGILPSGKSQNSFIPYDIKRKFGLPSYKEKDAIYAYHFYRLLNRAKNIKLIYNTQNDGLKGGEKSRFVYQLMDELKAYCPSSEITETIINETPPKLNSRPTAIEKNEAIIEHAKQYLSHKGWSASSLNNYLNCPLNFYYERLLGIKPSEKGKKEVESNVFGNIVHGALNALYLPYLKVPLTEKIIREIQKELDNQIGVQFRKELSHQYDTGIKKLGFEVAKKYIQRVLDYDLNIVNLGQELIIEEVEVKKEGQIHINDLGLKVKLTGSIDRIDSLNGTKRIVDYKTGNIEQRRLTNKNFENLRAGSYKEFSQLIFYQYLMNNEIDSIGLLPLKNRKLDFLEGVNQDLQIPNNKDIVERLIIEVTKELLDQDLPFEHSVKSKYCQYCN